MRAPDVRPTREARFAGSPAEGTSAAAPRRLRRSLAATAGIAALLALFLRFVLAGDDASQAAPPPPVAGRGAAAQIASLQQQLAQAPGTPRLLTDLGLAYLARAAETADPTYFSLADTALGTSYRADAGDLRTLVGVGLLRLARHDFRGALAIGQRAARSYPESADALGVVVDAQVELGRYADANRSAQQMVDLKPTLAAFARISYLRELQGDPAGAAAAMTQAATAGAGSAADTAYVQTLVGDLERQAGRSGTARAAYDAALRSVPSYGPAIVGEAQLDAAQGRLPAARAALADLVQRLPLPETVALYGDVLAADGRRAEAAQQYALVRQIETLQEANGVTADFESARYAADHARDPGADPAAAVAMARAAHAARPTIYGADVVGWALRQAGQPRAALPWADSALRFRTQDAVLWWHRAVISADLGRLAAARSDLRTALRLNPAFSVREAPAVRALAARLGVAVPR